MMDSVITLYSNTYTKNKYGVTVPGDQTKLDVFCQVRSISQTEFFEAGRNGLNPSFVFTVFAADYNNETLIEYEGLTYSVYRTYINGDYIELYVERKGATNTNGEEDNS